MLGLCSRQPPQPRGHTEQSSASQMFGFVMRHRTIRRGLVAHLMVIRNEWSRFEEVVQTRRSVCRSQRPRPKSLCMITHVNDVVLYDPGCFAHILRNMAPDTSFLACRDIRSSSFVYRYPTELGSSRCNFCLVAARTRKKHSLVWVGFQVPIRVLSQPVL